MLIDVEVRQGGTGRCLFQKGADEQAPYYGVRLSKWTFVPARTPCSGRSLSTSGRLSSDRQSAARQNGDARRIGERHPHPGETMTIDNHTHYIEDPNATTPPPQVELVGSVPTPPMPSPSEAMTIQVTPPRAPQAARPTGTPVQLSATWSKAK